MIILTGSTGFVGKNLTSYLSYNHNITGLPRAELGGGDKRAIEDSSMIIHLAGKAHDLGKVTDPSEYYEINYGLTKELYDAFLMSPAKKFIFISSVKAVTDHSLDLLTEETIPNPKSYYGKSKLMAEEYITSLRLPDGKSYYILRPCMIHGPGNKGNLNLLHKFVSRGIPYPLACFTNERSFLSVNNLCFIIEELIKRDDIPSGIYNVADDEPLSTNEVVTLLAEAQSRSPRLLKIPRNIIRLVAKIGDKLRLPLNTERLQKLTENFVVSNDKIKSVLKKELPLSVREGILKTARSFKNA